LVWRNFVAAIARQETYAFEQQGLVKALFSTQPAALLDEITAGDENTTREMLRLLHDAGQVDGNPVEAIPTEKLLSWCRAAPAKRFLQAAAIITPVTSGGDGAAAQWTPAAQALLEEAPDRVAVLDKFLCRFKLEGWSGSLAAILDSRAALLLGLGEHHDRHLAEHAQRAHAALQRQIAMERKRETQEHRSRDERFE
jgi:PAS domain-containing protein